MNEKLQWTLIAVFFLVTGYFVWTTASVVWSIIWGIGILLVGLGVTGVLGSLFGKKNV